METRDDLRNALVAMAARADEDMPDAAEVYHRAMSGRDETRPPGLLTPASASHHGSGDSAAPVVRRRLLVAATGAAVAVVVAVVVLVNAGGGEQGGLDIVESPSTVPSSVPTTSLAVPEDATTPPFDWPLIDVADQVERFDVTESSHLRLAAHGDSIWVSTTTPGSPLQNSIVRVDPDSGAATATIDITGFGQQDPWFPPQLDELPELYGLYGRGLFRIDPDSNELTDLWAYDRGDRTIWAAGVSADAVWIVGSDSGERSLERIDRDTGSVVATVALPYDFDGASGPPRMLVDDDLWLVTGESVVRVDPDSNSIVAVIETRRSGADRFGRPPEFIAGETAVWLIESGRVTRIDPATNTVVAEISLPAGVRRWMRAVLVADSLILGAESGQVHRIDTATNTFDAAFDLFGIDATAEGQPELLNDLVAVDDWLWFSTEEALGRVSLSAVTGQTGAVQTTDLPRGEKTLVAGESASGEVHEPFPFTSVAGRNDLPQIVDLGQEARDLFGLVAADGSLWTQRDAGSNLTTTAVLRIDPVTSEVIAVVDLPELRTEDGVPTPMGGTMLGGPLTPVFTAFGDVWASHGDGRLYRIDPASNTVVATIDLRELLRFGHWNLERQMRVTADDESFWIWPGTGGPWRIDPATNTVVAAGEPANAELDSQAPGWVVLPHHRVQRVDPATGYATVGFDFSNATAPGLGGGREVLNLAVGDGAVWVIARRSVTRIDPATNEAVATLPHESASGGGSAAFVDETLLMAIGGTLFQVDTNTDTIVAAVGVGISIENMAVVGDELWLLGRELQVGAGEPTEVALSRIALSELLVNT